MSRALQGTIETLSLERRKTSSSVIKSKSPKKAASKCTIQPKKESSYEESMDYGYEETDYGYGDEPEPKIHSMSLNKPFRPQRRNSCLIRKDQNPLAVAEFLLGPPKCPDHELDDEDELLF